MNDFDDHVIPYEDAVRRRRAIEEAQRQKPAVHEVKISDAMSHLLEEEVSPDEEGPSPETLRRIVEREFADEGGRAALHVVEAPREQAPREPEEDDAEGPACTVEDRTCDDVEERSEEPPRH